MSNKGKIIRYTIEIIILFVLVFALRSRFIEQSPVDYPGNWIKTPGPSSNTVHSLLWVDKNTLLAGSKVQENEGGIAVYRSKQIKWVPSNIPVKKSQIVMDFARSNNRIYASHFFTDGNPGNILSSENQGQSWSIIGAFPSNLDPRCICLNESGRMFVGTVNNGIYTSDDNGKTWNPSNAGLTNKSVQCLHVDIRNPSRLYAGTLRGLFISKDSGLNWVEKPMGEGNFLVIDIEENPLSNLIYLIYRDENGLAHIVKSGNSGESWKAMMGGLPADVQPRCLAFHPELKDSVFIGTVYDGVYRSDNTGKFWSPMNNELPLDTHYIVIHALEFSSGSDIKLYAGTDLNGSVWEYRFNE